MGWSIETQAPPPSYLLQEALSLKGLRVFQNSATNWGPTVRTVEPVGELVTFKPQQMIKKNNFFFTERLRPLGFKAEKTLASSTFLEKLRVIP